MSGLHELQPAVFHERDVAACELDLEKVRVMRRAEQHGLALHRDPFFPVLQDPPADGVGLLRFVQARLEDRAAISVARGPELLVVPLG